ncbi:hypothetical protein IAI10_09345 [Clostridium sp. 19966]|uniref:hypothetical protein n=1 Tax=Clostridium sp. 19966 TaxID=2768166 RepID=UPI0028DDD077|nr:hypothetical protein [Clostridium sp. 19966]MDT8716862.1 hypothetical protein [Clostridium sp. 19966]
MDKNFKDYIDIIINNMGITGKEERKIREDLYSSLLEKQNITGENDPYKLLGDPYEIAEDFIENLGISHSNSHSYRRSYGFEYVSKTKVFGLPLVHVNSNPFGIAKGIFSFGVVSVGVFSFGALSLGVISFGGIALGIIAFGGVAVSALLSMGGAAVSYFASLGGASIAKCIAIGGYAKADIAIGGVADGIVAIFNQHGTGQYMFKMPANADEVAAAIRKVKPNMAQWIINLIKGLL